MNATSTSATCNSACHSTTSEPSTSQIVELVAELNNEGAFHVKNGLHGDAIQVLLSALRLAMTAPSLVPAQAQVIRAALEVSREAVVLTHTEAPAAAAAKPKKSRRRRRHRRDSITSLSSKDSAVALAAASHQKSRRRRRKLPGQTKEVFLTEDIARTPIKAIYHKALRVVDRYNLPSFLEMTLFLVYNLALACHLDAFTKQQQQKQQQNSTDVGSSTWKRVLKLYKAIVTFQESAQHEDDDDDEEEDLPLLDPNHTLALYNNFACAYHSSGNDAKADETWENVLSQLWCILDVGFNSDEVECIPDALANAAHLLDPHLGCTAIAA